jgi:molybdenum cofactor biosynthesis protein B
VFTATYARLEPVPKLPHHPGNELPRQEREPPYNSPVSVTDHRRDAPATITCFVLTISDTRTEANDSSGDAIVNALQAAGHHLAGRGIVRDEPFIVRNLVLEQAGTVDIVIATGGTGLTSRDSTYEAISGVLNKRIDGFGELFRMLSFAEIGSAAMLSRACAGTVGRTAVFSLPGSENAVRLAMTRLILPELGHIVRELRR